MIPAKDLMPEFIEAGIYNKDHRNGLPIRNDLRELDEKGELNSIPFVHVIRKNVNRNWYFIPSGTNIEELRGNFTGSTSKKTSKKKNRAGKNNKDSDENYILDLCDEVLGLRGFRQHRFDFLFGDLHRNGKTRTKLPCDIYYPDLDLVIEYNERQHTESIKHFDKPDKQTISGVHRGEQRLRYDERRRKVLPQHGIMVIDFSYFDFEHNGNRRLKRNKKRDLAIIKQTFESNGVLVE
ncbi:hypothetical protein [Rhodohalobacter sp. SW132]|uniref:hypothetical protein n=1 Tax=Rhodohalobacter sp. SW132 TaxID=2293433 RepID=UPI0018F60A93|nr:hypothetical protein [Rhodohalobacter sp. SW132]